MVKKKQRENFDFGRVSVADLEFVKVANKKVCVPDSSVV